MNLLIISKNIFVSNSFKWNINYYLDTYEYIVGVSKKSEKIRVNWGKRDNLINYNTLPIGAEQSV